MNLLFRFISSNWTLYQLFPKFEETLGNGKQITEERPLVGKTWTPQLLLFLWSLLVRVNFIFIFFFLLLYLSLSLTRSLTTISINPASLKLLWRRSDNTIHSLLYLAMASSGFRLEIKKIFLNRFDFFLNNLHLFIFEWFLYFNFPKGQF